MKSMITCHGQYKTLFFLSFHWTFLSVLDSSIGKPAEAVSVRLQYLAEHGDTFHPLAEGFDPMFFVCVKLIAVVQCDE
jgi:hypothetical protein